MDLILLKFVDSDFPYLIKTELSWEELNKKIKEVIEMIEEEDGGCFWCYDDIIEKMDELNIIECFDIITYEYEI